jgi:hypothetical protein
MTDFESRFGNIVISAATSGTSANTLDFGPIDDKAVMKSHRTGEQHDLTAVFIPKTAVSTAVVLTPKLQDSDTDVAANYKDLVTGVPVTISAGTGDSPPPASISFGYMPFPKTHKRYVRAALTAGASTTITVEAYLEAGPEIN